MAKPDFTSPREAARAFTPKLSALTEDPLYSQVWEDADLSKRDRSLITVAALVALGRADELPAHLRRATEMVSPKPNWPLRSHISLFMRAFPRPYRLQPSQR
jgi:alkylhydroperoxidase/carboxymuconolactone decarboxylase family protein YurZ